MEIKDVTNREVFSTKIYWEEKGKRKPTFYVVSSDKKKKNNTTQPLLGVTIDDEKQKPLKNYMILYKRRD